MRMYGIYLATWSLFWTCLALPEIHKQMSLVDLQSVFYVDDHNSVPDYELVKLTHHGILHSVHKRSIKNLDDVSPKESHHVKKDLSKSPYYSELKLALTQHGGNSLSDHNFSDKLKSLDLSQIKEHNVSFSAFGEVHNLTLKPTEGLFKDGLKSLRMWTVRSEPNSTQGVQYEEINDDSENSDHVGEVFQDEENMAAILMRRQLETGDLIMEGSIGHELVIRPLPKGINPNKDEVMHHVIYKRQIDSSDQLSDFAFMEPDRLQKRYRERRSATASEEEGEAGEEANDDPLLSNDTGATQSSKKRSKRDAPYVIYPEILVIVDYDGYRLHGGDNIQVKRYFVSFWNGVDLRYRLLKGPRIRISIAGIIISRGRDATPYLERNRVGRDAIDSAAALTDMGKYLFRERRLPVYDIAVAITKYDMCRRRKGGRCTKGTAGFAYVGGACVVNKRLEKVNSVAIIEDTGGFSGIIVAAHEVGHLLGAVHDGSPPPSYLGGPGAEKCRWEDGYIMSDLRHTERGFRWSPCTVQSFHHFLNGDTASCLHNAPHEDEALGRALPGTLLSLDAQCRRDRGTYACFKDDRVCAQLFCFDSLTGYCVAYRPAAEGSSCGSGLHCLDGRCVAQQQQQNSIPNYTQQGYSNLYRPVFNDEDEEIEDTTLIVPSSTRSTTTTKRSTTSTTTTTTTQPSSSDRSYDDYLNSFPESTDNPSNDPKPIESVDKTTPRYTTSKRPASINPFYFGFSKITTKPPPPQTQNINNNYYQSSSIGTTKNPFSFLPLINPTKHNNNNNNNNVQKPLLRQLTIITTTDRPTTRTTQSNYIFYNNNNNDRIARTTTKYNNSYNIQSGGSSTKPTTSSASLSKTPNSFFDSYFRKLASTTRSPYNFDNLAQYYKFTTKSPPSYSSNFLGDNSNQSPLHVSITG